MLQFMMNPRRRRHTMVGVDIGSSSVKVVEISASQGDGSLTLERCASELLEKGVVVDGNVVQVDATAAAISAALRKARIHTRVATLALPATLTESTTLSLPDNLPQEELGIEVEHEAQRLYPPSEVISYDHGVVARNPATQTLTVQIVATRRECVQDRAQAAELAGLKVHAVEAEDAAIHRVMVLRAGAAQSAYAVAPVEVLVHLGASHSTAVFYQGGMPVHREAINSVGEHLTEHCARAFHRDYQQAEIQKRKNSLPREWRAQILKPALELLSMEIQSAISSFAARSTLGTVQCVLLCGGHALLADLRAAVAAQTHVATEILNPFADMKLGKQVNTRYYERDQPAHIVSAGLGMRGLVHS